MAPIPMATADGLVRQRLVGTAYGNTVNKWRTIYANYQLCAGPNPDPNKLVVFGLTTAPWKAPATAQDAEEVEVAMQVDPVEDGSDPAPTSTVSARVTTRQSGRSPKEAKAPAGPSSKRQAPATASSSKGQTKGAKAAQGSTEENVQGGYLLFDKTLHTTWDVPVRCLLVL